MRLGTVLFMLVAGTSIASADVDLPPPADRMVPGIGNPAERMLPALTNAGQAYRMIAVDTGTSPLVTSP